jgi:SAM-dependent methyltransferase
MNKAPLTLDANIFAALLDTTVADIEEKCSRALSGTQSVYTMPGRERFETILLEVLQKLDETPFSVSGKDRHNDWESGWLENLRAFISNPQDFSALVPRYIYKFGTKRLFSQYIEPLDNDFELRFYNVYRHWLFKTYLAPYPKVYEFGCGTGYNLVMLAQIFPDKQVIGLDWAGSSIQLVDYIAASHGFQLEGRTFDFFQPDYTMEIPDRAAFVTLNAMEQLGGDFRNFVDFVLAKKPALCINSEPLVEFYEPDNLLDYLAIKYHHKRNYLAGYLTCLRELAGQKRIEIIKEQRIRFGSLFHEGYSIVVWRVL